MNPKFKEALMVATAALKKRFPNLNAVELVDLSTDIVLAVAKVYGE